MFGVTRPREGLSAFLALALLAFLATATAQASRAAFGDGGGSYVLIGRDVGAADVVAPSVRPDTHGSVRTTSPLVLCGIVVLAAAPLTWFVLGLSRRRVRASPVFRALCRAPPFGTPSI